MIPAPKRVVTRRMFGLDAGGSTGIQVLRAAGDPVTLVRVILDYITVMELQNTAIRKAQIELWRKSNSAGSALPTFDTSGDVVYADNKDLIWRMDHAMFRDTVETSDPIVRFNYDLKSMRKLARDEDLILRFAGTGDVHMIGLVTTFYKEA